MVGALFIKPEGPRFKIESSQLNEKEAAEMFRRLTLNSDWAGALGSSGFGRRLMFRRSWVRNTAPYTGWT